MNDLLAERGPCPSPPTSATACSPPWTSARPLAAPGYCRHHGLRRAGSLGLQAATGERALILVGDGAFQMTGWELGNCRRYGWDPIVLLFTQRELGDAAGIPAGIGFNDLGGGVLPEMAAGLGAMGCGSAPGRAEGGPRPGSGDPRTLPAYRGQSAPGVLSQTLTRFVAGIKRLARANNGAAGRLPQAPRPGAGRACRPAGVALVPRVAAVSGGRRRQAAQVAGQVVLQLAGPGDQAPRRWWAPPAGA